MPRIRRTVGGTRPAKVRGSKWRTWDAEPRERFRSIALCSPAQSQRADCGSRSVSLRGSRAKSHRSWKKVAGFRADGGAEPGVRGGPERLAPHGLAVSNLYQVSRDSGLTTFFRTARALERGLHPLYRTLGYCSRRPACRSLGHGHGRPRDRKHLPLVQLRRIA